MDLIIASLETLLKNSFVVFLSISDLPSQFLSVLWSLIWSKPHKRKKQSSNGKIAPSQLIELIELDSCFIFGMFLFTQSDFNPPPPGNFEPVEQF